MSGAIEKVVGRNELGHTGSHQAGIVIPKAQQIIEFFPALDASEFNPRKLIHFWNEATQRYWPLNYIYYNGKIHGFSTRNEYRLTGITQLFRLIDIDAGDLLSFVNGAHGYEIAVKKSLVSTDDFSRGRIALSFSGDWFYEETEQES